MNRYRINSDGTKLIPAPKTVIYRNKVVSSTDELLDKLGFMPLLDIPIPELKENDTLITKYEYVEEEYVPKMPESAKRRKIEKRKRKVAIKPIYEVIYGPPPPEPVYTVDDYDNAMEDYLREVRVARGYTTREPDDYFGSTNPRWAQDARDWVAFRDSVMLYALPILNEYKKTGAAPTLADFTANFPKMAWTYQDEEV